MFILVFNANTAKKKPAIININSYIALNIIFPIINNSVIIIMPIK